MAELRGAGDAPDDGDTPARRSPADAGGQSKEDRPPHEPSPRAEYADLSRRNTADAAPQADPSQSDVDQVETAPKDANQPDAAPRDANQEGAGQPDADPEGRDLETTGQRDTDQTDADPENADPEDADPEGPGQAGADPEDAAETDPEQPGTDEADSDRSTEGSLADVLERFDPQRAGLPEVSRAEATAYIEEHVADRPWLAMARDCPPDVQRVIVALDQGHGHAHIRHEGWVTEEMNERRIRYLEDPAQLDPAKREACIDGLAADDQPHWCGRIATRITDPEAFAKAFARGVEHPDVLAALDSAGPRPEPVTLPISDILGHDGYKFCSGWQLEPIDGSMAKARNNRDAWAAGDRSGPEPSAHPVETFEGGTVTFAFQRSAAGGYKVSTMYVNPSDELPT